MTIVKPFRQAVFWWTRDEPVRERNARGRRVTGKQDEGHWPRHVGVRAGQLPHRGFTVAVSAIEIFVRRARSQSRLLQNVACGCFPSDSLLFPPVDMAFSGALVCKNQLWYNEQFLSLAHRR